MNNVVSDFIICPKLACPSDLSQLFPLAATCDNDEQFVPVVLGADKRGVTEIAKRHSVGLGFRSHSRNPCAPTSQNSVRSYDFVFDSGPDGRSCKCLTVEDN